MRDIPVVLKPLASTVEDLKTLLMEKLSLKIPYIILEDTYSKELPLERSIRELNEDLKGILIALKDTNLLKEE